MTWKQNARQCHHLAVVWIEIIYDLLSCNKQGCHHLAVVWIEIVKYKNDYAKVTVTTLRWCGLKFLLSI